MDAWVVKRGFGVGTLEVSFDEGVDEGIVMFGGMKIKKREDDRAFAGSVVLLG